MLPSRAIKSLDATLAKHGQTVTVRRYTAPSGDPRPKLELTDKPAFVRSVKAEEMVGDIKATALNVTMSPTDVSMFWPLLATDKLVINGHEYSIQAPIKPFYMDDVLVRVNLVVAG